MTNKQIQQKLYFTGTIITGLVALFTAFDFLANQSIYIIVIFSCVAIALTIQYFRVVQQDKPESTTNKENSTESEITEVATIRYKYPEIRNLIFLKYFSFIIPLIGVVVCVLIYSFSSDLERNVRKSDVLAKVESLPSCMSEELPSRSICIAKFTEDEIDKFSQSLMTDLSGKTDSKELRVVDHDSFVYSGRNLQRQLDSIKYMHCIDTGMIVHGVRSSTDSIFYCQVNFLNYGRRDTLIDNPNEIRFSFPGHVKYLSNFLLAQNESSNKEYRYALNLFLDAKRMGGGDEFNSIVDYYIGNMYFNLNELDSARVYYEEASRHPSSIKDFALNQLTLTEESYSERFLISNDTLSVEESRKEQSKVKGLLNNQFRMHTSSYFEIKRYNKKEIQYIDFVELTNESWDVRKKPTFASTWMIVQNGEIHCFEMYSGVHNSPSTGIYITSRIKKKWSVSTDDEIQCVLSSKDNSMRGGWNLKIFKSKNINSQNVLVDMANDWYYYSIMSGKLSYSELEYYTRQKEVDLIADLEFRLNRFLTWARVNFSIINKIEVPIFISS